LTASFVSSMRHSLSPLTPKLTAFIGRNSLFHSAAPSRSQHSVMESPTNRIINRSRIHGKRSKGEQ